MSKTVLVRRIIQTGFSNEHYFINYVIKDDDVNQKFYKVGFELSSSISEDENTILFSDFINDNKELFEKFTNKPILDHSCSKFLSSLVINCLQSDNDMWYIDYDDMSLDNITQDMLISLKTEVSNLNLEDYIVVDDGEYAICVYGGVITKFLY